MCTLWQLILTGRLKSRAREFDLHRWIGRFKRTGLTPILRLELREILTPRVVLRDAFHWSEDSDQAVKSVEVWDQIDWDVVLSADDVHSRLPDLAKTEDGRQ